MLKDHFSELQNLTAPKNGYVYIYVSNESPVNVFFDNLQVVHIRSPIVEETHYYPFGLTMQGISSKALVFGNPDNKYKYNGIEKENDLQIEIYDAQLRELDGQVGVWWQIDPKTEDMEMWSPYVSNYDNPIRYSDPLGDEGQECCQWLTDAKNWVVETATEAGDRFMNTVNGVGTLVKDTWNQAGENFRNRQDAGVLPWQDPIGTFGHPMTWIGPPVGQGGGMFGRTAANGGRVAVVEFKTVSRAELTAIKTNIVKPVVAVQSKGSTPEQRAEKLSQVDRSGKDFTKAGKEAVKDVNKVKNNGQMKCEGCNQEVQNAAQSSKGVKPPANEAQVDHIRSKAKKGSGTPNNGQVLCRGCNQKKGVN